MWLLITKITKTLLTVVVRAVEVLMFVRIDDVFLFSYQLTFSFLTSSSFPNKPFFHYHPPFSF